MKAWWDQRGGGGGPGWHRATAQQLRGEQFVIYFLLFTCEFKRFFSRESRGCIPRPIDTVILHDITHIEYYIFFTFRRRKMFNKVFIKFNVHIIFCNIHKVI